MKQDGRYVFSPAMRRAYEFLPTAAGAYRLFTTLQQLLLTLLLLLGFLCILTPQAEASRFVPASAPAIQYFGRWDFSRPERVRTGRGAVYLRVDFTGTSLRLQLQEDRNWWRASIDGRDSTKFRPRTGTVTLAENLSPGRHQLVLTRITEGENGISSLAGFHLDDGAELLRGEPPAARRLEIIGDSIAAGAMNDGPQALSYAVKEDGLRAFAPRLAQALGAEWSVTAKSGEGVVRNYGEGTGRSGIHTIDTYPRTFYTEPRPIWTTARFAPQAVLLAMGTNDFSDGPGQPSEREFTAGYTRLLQSVRERNPEAVLIAVEPMALNLGPQPGQWIEQAVAARRAAGDTRLYYIPVHPAARLQPADFVGDETHPTAEGAQKIADYLKPIAAAILGWQEQ